jgi:pimeloyl-ACP methyl ester carboxylesterase
MRLNILWIIPLSLAAWPIEAFATQLKQDTPIACTALVGYSYSPSLPRNALIASATLIAGTDTLPEHCDVQGTIDANRQGYGPTPGDARTASLNQIYAIRWRMRLPTQWNGRFYFAGGGGTNGNLGDALGGGALARGYAVVAQDSGHNNAVNTTREAGIATFGYDPRARIDFGYRSYDQVTRLAKKLIELHYARGPEFSYYVGCSEGGREGLVMSQRFPQHFDGVVAGNPGMDLHKSSLAEAHAVQEFAAAAAAQGYFTSTPPGTIPWANKAFTDAQLIAVGNAILKQCDDLDGLTDGSVDQFEACRFDPITLGPTGSGELNAAQVTALKNVFAGPRNRSGRPLYSSWYWDPGIASTAGFISWRNWKMGAYNPTQPFPPFTPVSTNTAAAQSIGLGGASVPFLFRTPPNTPTAAGVYVTGDASAPDALMPFILSYSFDSDAPLIFAKTDLYRTSAAELMYSSSTDYRKFKALRHKLIVYTGGADPVFSAKYHVDWYKRLARANRGFERTQQFARLFYVPGMQHCGGGIATDRFDAFSALVDWVERGKAPDQIIASVDPANPALDDLQTPIPQTRTRPLCPYPKYARYVGEGSIDAAENFECALPERGQRLP